MRRRLSYSGPTFGSGFGAYPQSLLKKASGVFRCPQGRGEFPERLSSQATAGPGEERRNMGKQSQNKFKKRQKELERKRKAEEKMARRQGKKPRGGEEPIEDLQSVPDEPDEV